ncbi:MAG: methylmalonyl-CoA mutase family protein [candidate division Zixibacteria bacterium]|nr:methylmalonyl-CoA mutase family protein [candidate division Zixibacteria bacterium]
MKKAAKAKPHSPRVESSGLTRGPKIVHTARDVKNFKALEKRVGKPGDFPFTRGIYPDMYRGRLWTMRQYAGYGTAKESNERYRYLLSQGVTGLSVAFDLPTQIGYDSDSPFAAGEVGKTGVAICSIEDMELLFDGIPLEKVSVSMTINATAIILLALYVAVAKKRRIPLSQLSGTVQNDILKEFIARGTYIFPPKPSMRLVTSIFQYAKDYLPKWNTISISGYHIREAGSTAAQELAFTFADAIEYVRAALSVGLKIDEFAPRLSFFFNAHQDFFEEVAKFRAARRIWARIMKEKFKARKPDSLKLRFHAQTAGSSLTAQQLEVNIVRTALEALSAVLGGTQSLHTNAYDEALALPTEKSAQLALRTQQVIAHETGAPATVDPLGGSYYVEHLTDRLEEESWEYLNKIEKMGGAAACVETGFFQREIQQSAYEYQKQVETGQKIVVGVNKFVENDRFSGKILKVDPKVREDQIARLAQLRQRRNGEMVQRKLGDLRKTAQGTEGMFPVILDCVENNVTLGEICAVLREEWGEYRGAVVL